MSGHRALLCIILLYFTVDLSLTMMPQVYESDTFLEGTQASRTFTTGDPVMRSEPAVEPPVPKPLSITAPDVARPQHIALPRAAVAFYRPRAFLASAPLDVADPH
jgi:hypothetical protein